MRDNGRGRPGSEEIKLSGMTSVLSMGLKNGDVIHVFPLSGTRFHDPEEGSSQNGENTSEKSKTTVNDDLSDLRNSDSSGKLISSNQKMIANIVLTFSQKRYICLSSHHYRTRRG